jgi:predicted RNA-binding protein associated with RNAse of E/G family
VFLSSYVNFETPVVRTADGVDVNDLQLDIVIEPDGEWRWKDVQDLAPSLASGRITQDELLAVLAEAAHVAELLDRGDRWWAPWDEWSPQDGTI